MTTKPKQRTWRPIAGWEQPHLERLGRRLRALRRAAGITQAQLGAAAGLNAVSVRRIELGLRRTRRSTIRRLVVALGVPPDAVAPLVDELVTLAGPALAEESPWCRGEPMHVPAFGRLPGT